MELDEEELYFLVLFDDNSVQFVQYQELMIIAPYLRIRCIELMIDKLHVQA